MLRRTRTHKVKEDVRGVSRLTARLSRDRRFRESFFSALEHGLEAAQRVRRSVGLLAAARRLAADEALRRELVLARQDLEHARARVEAKRRSRRLRTLGLLAGLASLAAVPQVRTRLSPLLAKAPTSRDDLLQLKDKLPGTTAASAEPQQALEELTKEDLYARAQAADVTGRSDMSKDELIAALRARG
jgi:hypothetical protein